jgi:hypothetical protein
MGRVAIAVALWAAHFGVAYGFTALACARQMTAAIPWVVAVASIAAVLATAAIAIPAGMRAARTSHFADFVAAGTGVLAAIAIVWEAWALLGLPACA